MGLGAALLLNLCGTCPLEMTAPRLLGTGGRGLTGVRATQVRPSKTKLGSVGLRPDVPKAGLYTAGKARTH